MDAPGHKPYAMLQATVPASRHSTEQISVQDVQYTNSSKFLPGWAEQLPYLPASVVCSRQSLASTSTSCSTCPAGTRAFQNLGMETVAVMDCRQLMHQLTPLGNSFLKPQTHPSSRSVNFTAHLFLYLPSGSFQCCGAVRHARSANQQRRARMHL
jgi:hypothetical protein